MSFEFDDLSDASSDTVAAGNRSLGLRERCQRMELLVLDVDGVLTDGVIALDDRGIELKRFSVRDGAGISYWRKAGGKVAILSGRRSRAVDLRAAELGITPVIQGAKAKLEPFLGLLEDLGIPAERTVYMGDDLADLPPMGLAGLAACPSDAAAEVIRAADHVTRAPGGRGAVRELVEFLLDARGGWPPRDA
ncbi:3-deoxy-D-manno-octulosonate 8-phosphate phosphatase, YrbI family [Isosphaera pallida ATCC 43644]|uniref:3-deoxy-D-manno-octulosonate 8-phosphate phosphatase, YrbI family n=1 Tax=Isosphaera pallida (strain ATCC 43644 / DSM 9630 / IS1B) TaxID=575540 RepID=E8R634_ISOPI|nr:HAD family hydrolase [Isosphaera pallida]ADV60729.1 3-deoxy-D-manno-octulosonate 8-phosphate phosphatase, YrbI family [Isosphaera pallida ATCC 43644]